MADKSLAQRGAALAQRGSGKSFELGVAKLVTLAVQMQLQCRAMGLAGFAPHTRQKRLAKALREGEAEALARVLDVVDAHPQLLQALTARLDAESGQDAVTYGGFGGHGGTYAGAARAALARAADLAPVVEIMEEVLQLALEGVLASTTTARSVGSVAYEVASEKAKTNRRVATSLEPAAGFFEKKKPRRSRRRGA